MFGDLAEVGDAHGEIWLVAGVVRVARTEIVPSARALFFKGDYLGVCLLEVSVWQKGTEARQTLMTASTSSGRSLISRFLWVAMDVRTSMGRETRAVTAADM